MQNIRNRIMYRLTDKELILMMIFLIITIVGFIYSPWEKNSEFVMEKLFDDDNVIINIIENAFVKIFFYGILDWIGMMAYGTYEMMVIGSTYDGGGGILGFPVLGICFAGLLVFKIWVNHFEKEFFDTDVIWKLCIGRYMLERVMSYIFCLGLYLFILYFLIFACLMFMSYFVLTLSYAFLISIPF